MTPTYSQALAQLVPVIYPELLYHLTRDGKPMFPEFVAAIKPTKFAPGKTFGTGSMKPIDYMEALTNGRVPIPRNLNIRAIQQEAESMNFHYMFQNYAQRRAADWKARGYTETLADWPTLNARFEVLGRRSTGRVLELGGSRRYGQSYRPA